MNLSKGCHWGMFGTARMTAFGVTLGYGSSEPVSKESLALRETSPDARPGMGTGPGHGLLRLCWA